MRRAAWALLLAAALLSSLASPAASIKAYSEAWTHVLNEKAVLVDSAGPCPCLISYFVEASQYSVRAALLLLSSSAYQKYAAGKLRPDDPGQETVVVDTATAIARGEDFKQASVPDGEHLHVVIAPLSTGYLPVRVLVDIVPADGGSVTLPPGRALVLSSARACPCYAASGLATDGDPKELAIGYFDDSGVSAALGRLEPLASFFPSGAAGSAPVDAAAIQRLRERVLQGTAGTAGQRMHAVIANASPREVAVRIGLAMTGSPHPEVDFATGAPTSGGQVAIVGRHFGSRPELLGPVTLGGRPCGSPQLLLAGHLLRCDAPPGTGFALDVLVTVNGLSSGASGRRRFWYDGPWVANATSAPWSGGTVTIRGSNFGALGGEVSAWIGGRPCANARVTVAHSEIRCDAPPGTGSNLDAIVRVGGRPADFDLGSSFSYTPAAGGRPADGRRWALLLSEDASADAAAAAADGWRARTLSRASATPAGVRAAFLEAVKAGAEVIVVGEGSAARVLLRGGVPLQAPEGPYPLLVSSRRGPEFGPQWVDAGGYATARAGPSARVWAVRGEEGGTLRFPVQSFAVPPQRTAASNVSRHPSLGPFGAVYPSVAGLEPGGAAFLREAFWALPAAPAAGGGPVAALWAQRLLWEAGGGTLVVPAAEGSAAGGPPGAARVQAEALSAAAAAADEWRRPEGVHFSDAAASLARALAATSGWAESDAADAIAWLGSLREAGYAFPSFASAADPRPSPPFSAPTPVPTSAPVPGRIVINLDGSMAPFSASALFGTAALSVAPSPAPVPPSAPSSLSTPFYAGPAFLRPPLRAPPFVSFVIGTRNDNYGGSLHRRLQVFVDMLAGLCDRHKVEAELIAVEWNPPPDRVPLAQALSWPRPSSRLAVRIVTVPPEIHFTYENSRTTPHFEYISKNAGIRRARGQYIFSTNQDVILSSGMGELLGRRELDPDSFYMSRRFDVPAAIPPGLPYDEALQVAERQGLAHLVVFSGEPRMCFADYGDPEARSRLDAEPRTRGGMQEGVRVSRYAEITRDKVGDMLLMHRAMWERLKAYPELPTNSAIEMRLPANAAALGYKYVLLRPPYAIFHQDHEHHRWGRPVSDLPWDDLERVVQSGRPENANGADWGLAGRDLSDVQLA